MSVDAKIYRCQYQKVHNCCDDKFNKIDLVSHYNITHNFKGEEADVLLRLKNIGIDIYQVFSM